MTLQLKARSIAKASKTPANTKSVELAKENVRLCKLAASETAAQGAPGAEDTFVAGSAMGMKPALAARMADHLWENGKPPTRKAFRTYLTTVLASQPTADFVRRVADCSYSAHSEVRHTLVT